MPRIALAGFLHETNTFAPMITRFEDFAGVTNSLSGILRGEKIKEFRGKHFNHCVSGFYEAADRLGYEVVPLVWCAAEPAGQVTMNAFEKIMALICSGLVEQGPFDAVFLDLHGAMVYEGFHDGETEILRRVKAIVGDIPVVNALDLHGNITPKSIEISSAMVGYRTYPHVDLYETGQRCAYVLRHLLEGRPIFKAFRQIPYIPPIHTQSTNTEPARSLYAMLGELESDPKIVSATVMMGFPPADMPDCGASVFTYATTQKTADQACEKIYDFFLLHESDFGSDLPDAREGVAQAIQAGKNADKPVIVSDVQDNSGGGATSDTVWILEELVRQNAPDSALGLLFDPAAAAAAHEAGIGRQVTLDLGGKLTPGQTPFHATFTVEGLAEGDFICTGPMYKGTPANLGKMAQLRIGNVRVAVSSVRVQMADQSYFRQVGIEPLKMKIVVVKSANHFRADFEPISSTIIPVAAPGAIVEDPSKAEYHHLRDGIRLKGLGPVYHAQ